MLKKLVLCVWFVTVTYLPVLCADTVPIEDVFNFPEVYSGQTMDFDKVELSGDINTDEYIYCLEVSSKKGKKVSPYLKRSGITFTISRDFMKKLLEHVEPGQRYTVKLRGEIEPRDVLGENHWVADVSEIHFYGPQGTIVNTVK